MHTRTASQVFVVSSFITELDPICRHEEEEEEEEEEEGVGSAFKAIKFLRSLKHSSFSILDKHVIPVAMLSRALCGDGREEET